MFFWNQYTATVTKSAMKLVTCETCGIHFDYEVVRRAKGASDSLFCLDNRGAEERAMRYAQRNCDKQLAKAVNLVPCPKCGWFQKNMVRVGKRKRLLYTLLAAFPVSWAVALAQDAASNPASAPQSKLADYLPTIALFITVATAIFWYFWYDPNRIRQTKPSRTRGK